MIFYCTLFFIYFSTYIITFSDELISKFECDKIVGGQRAKKGEFPWMVGIWRNRKSSKRPFCGASLIGDR